MTYAETKVKNIEAHKWKPGQSGNPRGQPKKLRITAELRKLLDMKMTDAQCKRFGMRRGSLWAEAIARQLVSKAAGGDVRATREVADRDEGKPTQRVELMGGGEIKLRVVYEDSKK